MNPEIRTFFDHETFTASHVVIDPATQSCAIIDSVLDFDAGREDHVTKFHPGGLNHDSGSHCKDRR